MTLLALARHQSARVVQVTDAQPHDPVARRLRELGFVPGETVSLVATGPVGADPVLIQVGYTRFALRRAEAERVQVEVVAESA
jgi:ferrous iron transport protein A